MIGLLKILALLSGGIMSGIIGISKALNNGCLFSIIILLTLPIYMPLIGIYFISIAAADSIKRNSGRGNFYPEEEGLKDLGYYLSYGSEDTK